MPAPSVAAKPLALSIGEPGGIGAEIIAKAWAARGEESLDPFYVLADPAFLKSRLTRLGLVIPLEIVEPDAAVSAFSRALPVVPLPHAMTDDPGRLQVENAAAVISAIELGVTHIRDGRASGLVTAPIQKANLYAAGFAFPGHTEFLGSLAQKLWPGAPHEPVMMLAGPDLSTIPVTLHIPLADVPEGLTTERILTVCRIAARDLTRLFGIAHPRLSLAGLNPHAGENGTMGLEDGAVIAPAVRQLQAEGILATGPHPADTLFHARARKNYDVVIGMYHDQVLIPVKTIAFDETVNVTLGLPFIRTSPDHGTALDIASRNIANPASLIAAIRLAAKMATSGRELAA